MQWITIPSRGEKSHFWLLHAKETGDEFLLGGPLSTSTDVTSLSCSCCLLFWNWPRVKNNDDDDDDSCYLVFWKVHDVLICLFQP